MERFEMKVCSKCGIEKELSSFSKLSRSTDGLAGQCRQCMSIMDKLYRESESGKKTQQEYYKNNKTEINKKNRLYQEQNKKQLAIKSKQYRENNKENIANKHREYVNNNRDKVNERNRLWAHTEQGKKTKKEYAERNKDRLSEYQKDKYNNLSDEERTKLYARVKIYKQSDKGKAQSKLRSKEYRQLPKVKEKSRLQSLERQYRKLTTSDGSITVKSMRELLVRQNNKCFHCGCDLDFETLRAVHLDHLQPVSKGGKHVLSNVVYSCAFCNMSKGSNY